MTERTPANTQQVVNSLRVLVPSIRLYRAFESDKRVVCDGSCSKCGRCRRLYLCDAEDWEGIKAWRTWLDSRMALPNSSSSAILHSSSNTGRS